MESLIRCGLGQDQNYLIVANYICKFDNGENLRNHRIQQMKGIRLQSKASDIKFNHVGNRLPAKATHRSLLSFNESEEQPSCFNDEMDPSELSDAQWRQKIELGILKLSLIEDTRVSRFTYHQLLLVEKNILVLALLTIFLGMVKIEADYLFPSGGVSTSLMNVISCTTCMLVLLVVIRKVIELQLEIDQHRIYTKGPQRDTCRSILSKLVRDKSMVGPLLLQILAILPHPFNYLQGVQYFCYDQNQHLNFIYEVNDVLNLLMMAKIYLVFRALVAMSIYSSPRAVRLCTCNSINHSWFFSLKCIQQEYPLAFTTVISLVSWLIFGIGFRVTEGNLYYLNQSVLANKTGFEDYFTCLWFTFITMTSIGYGQYSPITPMGRFLACFTAIFGVILNSFLVVALTEYLRMKSGEIHSHTTTIRLREQKSLFGKSTHILSETIEATQMMSRQKGDPAILSKLRPVFESLRGKIEETKALSRHIKSILPQSNKIELMIHEFWLVKDSLKEVFLKQRKIKSKIIKIEELRGREVNREVKQCFMEEVKTLLKRFQ